MKRKATNTSKRSFWFTPLAAVSAVVILLAVATGYLLVDRSRLDKRLDASDQRLSMLSADVDSNKAMLRPVILPKDNQVLFPELRLALPYDKVTRTLMYYQDDQNNLRVTSSLIADHTLRQMSCDELLRVNTTSGTPYSPWEENVGTVSLGDSRTLNILAARAYKNDQASTMDCASQVWHDVTPQQVADEFKQAQTY